MIDGAGSSSTSRALKNREELLELQWRPKGGGAHLGPVVDENGEEVVVRARWSKGAPFLVQASSGKQ